MIGRSKSLNDVHQNGQCTPVMLLNSETRSPVLPDTPVISQLARTKGGSTALWSPAAAKLFLFQARGSLALL